MHHFSQKVVSHSVLVIMTPFGIFITLVSNQQMLDLIFFFVL